MKGMNGPTLALITSALTLLAYCFGLLLTLKTEDGENFWALTAGLGALGLVIYIALLIG
jgi:hypothetical protein|nr:MAG TPA: hypothetical protein [Caudoviricetes sp.]